MTENGEQTNWQQQLSDIKSQIGKQERDKEMRSQTDFGNLESPRLTEFLKWQEQYQSDLAAGQEPKLLIPSKEDKTFSDQPWGEWRGNYEDLKYGKSLAYACNNYVADELLQRFTSGEVDSYTMGFIALNSSQAEQQVLNFLQLHNDPKNITSVVAEGIVKRFLTVFNDQLDSCSDDISKTAAEVVIGAIGRFAQSCESQTDLKLQQSLLASEVWYQLGIKADETLWKPLEIDDNLNWIYYSTTSLWPVTRVDCAVASHSPNLDLPDYFQHADYKAGVALIGNPIKFFVEDTHSTKEEIELGESWTIESAAVIQAEMLSVGGNSTNEEYERQLSILKDIEATSAEDAWDRHGRTILCGYTEVWVNNPQAWAIWIDPEWSNNIKGANNRNSFALSRISHLKSLLASRPDLPVIYTGKNPSSANRDKIVAKINEIEESW